MVDRRINFGDPADAGTRYQIEDDANASGGGNFVLAKDLDGGTVLLQYNPTSDAFEYVRSVDMSGEDVTGVGGVVGESGASYVDDATQTVGDGTTSADHASVSTKVSKTATKPVVDVTHPDYGAVGDGSTDDTAAIDAAITEAGSNSVIWFPEGDFLSSGGHIIDSQNVTVDGPGTVVNSSNGRTFDIDGASDVTISVDVDGGEKASSCIYVGGDGVDSLTVRDCHLQNTVEGNLITLSHADDVLVENCELTEAGRCAVSCYEDVTNATIRDNYISGWMRHRDLYDGAIDAYSYNCRDLRAVNNQIDTTETGASTDGEHQAIRFQGASNVLVRDNTIWMRSPDSRAAINFAVRDGNGQDDTRCIDNTVILDADCSSNGVVQISGDIGGDVTFRGNRIDSSVSATDNYIRASGSMVADTITIDGFRMSFRDTGTHPYTILGGAGGTVDDVKVRNVNLENDNLNTVLKFNSFDRVKRVDVSGCNLVNESADGDNTLYVYDAIDYLTVNGGLIQGDPAIGKRDNSTVETVYGDFHEINNS